MDHFSKFHILFPTKTKEAEEIACLFKERVLAYFGAPHIFYSDNGREFCNQVLTKLMHNWSQKVTFVNGRPRHSQSQGLVERVNRIAEEKRAKIKTDQNLNDKIPWAPWLPEIMYSMNVERHRTTEDSPYRVVFGRVPPTPLLPQSESRLINEEDCNVFQNKDNLVSDFQEPISVPQKPIPAPRSSRPKTPPVTEDNLDNTPDPAIPVEDDSLRNQIHTTALENTKRKATQMSLQYTMRKCIKVDEFDEGDNVSIAVPEHERTATDMARIPEKIIKVFQKAGFYEVETQFGKLKTKLRAGDLQCYTDDVICEHTKDVTLRECSRKFNANNNYVKKVWV